MYLNTDLAFFINHGIKKETLLTKKIAITTRSQTIGDINELSAEKKQLIKQTLQNVTSELLEKDYQVAFVVQTKKDRSFTHEIFSVFNTQGNKVEFFENYDPIELIKFYSTCDLLLGMRLHSIILALTAGTPCIGYLKKLGLKTKVLLRLINKNIFLQMMMMNNCLQCLKTIV